MVILKSCPNPLLIQNLDRPHKYIYISIYIYIFPDCKGGELKVRRAVAHRSNAMWGKKPAGCSTISTLQEDSFWQKIISGVNIFLEAQRLRCLLVVQRFVWPLMVMWLVFGVYH